MTRELADYPSTLLIPSIFLYKPPALKVTSLDFHDRLIRLFRDSDKFRHYLIPHPGIDSDNPLQNGISFLTSPVWGIIVSDTAGNIELTDESKKYYHNRLRDQCVPLKELEGLAKLVWDSPNPVMAQA